MADFDVKKIDDMEAAHGVFRRVSPELGVSSLGISIQDHEPGSEMYPNHAEPDQEEVYLLLGGSAEMDVQGDRIALEPGAPMLRVGPGTNHKLVPGEGGARLLAIGGTPGRPYEPQDPSEIPIDGDGADEPDYTAKEIDDMERIYGGLFFRARAELGAGAFGIGVFDLPAGFDDYPEHDHSDEGQEEVYIVLSGSAELVVDGETTPIDNSVIARIGPEANRSVRTTDEPVRILALGAVPGEAYEPAKYTELGEPDPLDG